MCFRKDRQGFQQNRWSAMLRTVYTSRFLGHYHVYLYMWYSMYAVLYCTVHVHTEMLPQFYSRLNMRHPEIALVRYWILKPPWSDMKTR